MVTKETVAKIRLFSPCLQISALELSQLCIICIYIRTQTAQLFFAVTALSCYSEKELNCSGPSIYSEKGHSGLQDYVSFEKSTSEGGLPP